MKESVGKYIEQSFNDSRNWKGINDFVKVSLMSLLDMIKVNCTTVREIERELGSKASKNEIAGMMASKLSVSEFPALYQRYSSERTLANTVSRVELQLKSKIEEMSCLFKGSKVAQQNIESCQTDILIRVKQLQTLGDMRDKDLNNEAKRLEECLLRKADRSQVDNLCKLNQLFESELEQLSKSMADLSRFPINQQQVNQHIESRMSQQEKLTAVAYQTQQTYRLRIEASISSVNEDINQIHNSKMKITQQLVSILSRQEEQKKLEYQQTHRETVKQRENIEQLSNRHSKLMEGLQSRIETLELRQNNMNKLRLQCTKEFARISDLEEEVDGLNRRLDKPPESQDSTPTRILQALTETFDDELEKKIKILREVLETKLTSIESKLVSKAELNTLLSAKVDYSQYRGDLTHQLSKQQLLEGMSEVTDKYEAVMKKIDQLHEEFTNFKFNESKLNESFSHAIDNRISVSDLKQALQKMVSFSDLKLVVNELNKKVESSTDKELFAKFALDQTTINETLCSENILGRWVWNGQSLKNGNLIPWERQIINTLPENFGWQQNATVINITNNGLYKVEMGFYSRKKPTVQIIVNGNSVISAVNSNSYVVHHSSGKLKDVKSKENPVSGLTLVDFFLLPARARLAISYTGEEGQGFLSIRRL